MFAAEAHVETERPSRYLVQLCKHFENKGRHLTHRPRNHSKEAVPPAGAHMPAEIRPDQIHVEWDDTQGTVRFPWGVCALQATAGVLTLRAEGADKEGLERIQDLVTTHISRFSRRDPLKVEWRPSEVPHVQPEASARTTHEPTAARHWWPGGRTGFAAVGVVAVIVAVHLGLGGAVLADVPWTGWAVGFVVTAVLVKIAVVGGFAIRRSRRRTG